MDVFLTTHIDKIVQLDGEPGIIKPGSKDGTIVKPYNIQEDQFYRALNNAQPSMKKWIAKYESYTQDTIVLGNLRCGLYNKKKISTMDIKMGTRTFLESDIEDKTLSVGLYKRFLEEAEQKNGLYDEMRAIVREFQLDENHNYAITETDYKRWRDKISTTLKYGFRITAFHKAGENKVEKLPIYGSKEEAKQVITHFIGKKKKVAERYYSSFKEFHATIKLWVYFYDYEIIDSSLYLIHDNKRADVYMIDFEKTIKLPYGITNTHYRRWENNEYEDGYLTGVIELMQIFKELADDFEEESCGCF